MPTEPSDEKGRYEQSHVGGHLGGDQEIEPPIAPVGPAPGAGLAASQELFFAQQRTTNCGLGLHAWMPWIEIRRDDGLLLCYETYCVNCRRPEQFDV